MFSGHILEAKSQLLILFDIKLVYFYADFMKNP